MLPLAYMHACIFSKIMPCSANSCARRLAPAVAPTPDDAEALASVQSIVELLRTEGVLEGMDAAGSRRLALTLRQLAPLLPELAPGIGYTGAWAASCCLHLACL